MAGEAPGNLQSWRKDKQTCPSSHGSRKEKCRLKGGTSLIRTSDLMRTHSLSQEQHGGNYPTIQLPPTRSLPWHVGIMRTTIQDAIWVGTQPNHISSQTSILDFCVPTGSSPCGSCQGLRFAPFEATDQALLAPFSQGWSVWDTGYQVPRLCIARGP